MIDTGKLNTYRNLRWEQFFLDRVKNLTREQKALLSDDMLRKINKSPVQLVREKFETKAQILAATGLHFATIFWEDEINDDDAAIIFKKRYSYNQHEEAKEKIFERNVFIVGDKSWWEWMMLSQFYFDTAYYTVAKKLATPFSQLSRTGVTKIIDDNKVFFRTVYSCIAKYENMTAYLKTLDINKSELLMMFQLFNEGKPMTVGEFRDLNGIQFNSTAKSKKRILKMVEKKYIEVDTMRNMDNPIANKSDFFILSAKGYLTLRDITERLFRNAEI